MSVGRPVSVPAVPDICHIGRNGSRATPRLKITTISLSHSIAALPVLPALRVCMSGAIFSPDNFWREGETEGGGWLFIIQY